MSDFIAVGNSEPTPDHLPEEIKKIINDDKRKAGFNPDGTPMTKDTNQASEDELRTLDDILSQAFTDGASDTMWQDERHVEIFATAKKELLALIRNEKLKLLAEVRERAKEMYMPALRVNAVLISEIDKMEAEL